MSNLKQKIQQAFDNGDIDPNTCYPQYMYDDIMKIVDDYELMMEGAIVWGIEDMIATAANLSDPYIMDEETALEALRDMINRHDCNIGITWDTLEYYANLYRPAKIEE